MSRIPFISALLVSVALIGGATWIRLSPIDPSPAQITSAPKIERSSSGNLEDLADADPSFSTTSASQLAPTDLIGRQLFTDYLALRTQGKTTPDDISALANKYAEDIKNSDLSIPKVAQNQITILPDSAEQLALYGNAMASIRTKYKNLVATQVEVSGSNITDIGSRTFSTFMGAVSKLYQSSANELLALEVPASLAENHLNLINNYLESTEVMTLLSNISKDPIQAYAAINIYAQHTEKEAELFLYIQKVMMANGIIFNSNI